MEKGISLCCGHWLLESFDALNQDILKNAVREIIKDRTPVKLIKSFVKAGAVPWVRMDDGIRNEVLSVLSS